MRSPHEVLKRLTDDCTLEVLADGGIAGGSGFFVAPGVVVTCAHVVASGDRITAARATVRWRGAAYGGQVRARPLEKGPARVWATPDLCVISLDRVPPGQPQVVLGELRETDTSEIYVGGFTQVYDTATGFQGTPGRLAGPQGLGRGRVWGIVDSQLSPGMSGGPVLDPRRGVVCGVTKCQRKKDTSLGGLVIPAAVLRQEFGDVWQANQDVGQDHDDWSLQRKAVLDISDPLGRLLTPSELGQLISLAAGARLRRADFSQLWRDIAGPRGPRPPFPLDDVTALAHAVADLLIRPDSDEPAPLVRLFELLQDRQDTPADPALSLARRLGQESALSDRRRKAAAAPEDDSDGRPVIVVRLNSRTADPEREVLLDIWCYECRGDPPYPVEVPPGPYPLSKIEQVVTDVLADLIPDLPPHRPILIEFALPDRMLDDAVEWWTMDGLPIGDSHAVVVRFADRKPLQRRALQSRSEQFRDSRLPPKDSQQWDELWVDCADTRDLPELHRGLQFNGRLPLVAMTAWHPGRPVPVPVEAARSAGAPVILWRHQPCADHQLLADHGSCGSAFRDTVARELGEEPLSGLPEAVWQVRTGNGSPDSPARRIAILWDDPDRLPWWNVPLNRQPRATGSG
ncbi:MAG TPA: trypsin-like peptidase domain-containing protein [Streptosporangiaceae bacterium]|nr:trypsin-like peptidase domain-containing protein [Streptosporangiaceae bacterium]